MKILSSINELLFPQRCISCKNLGGELCLICLPDWKFDTRRQVLQAQNGARLTVFSSVNYSDVARSVILAAKESAIRDADNLIMQALKSSLSDFLHLHSVTHLVPIPSRSKAVRTRGRDFLAEITEALAHDFALESAVLLRHNRTVRDQSGLSRASRRNNLTDAFVLIPRRAEPTRVSLLLVDDLVTTGATLLEAARALRYAGFEVSGAVTAAVAQPLR